MKTNSTFIVNEKSLEGILDNLKQANFLFLQHNKNQRQLLGEIKRVKRAYRLLLIICWLLLFASVFGII